VGRISPLE